MGAIVRWPLGSPHWFVFVKAFLLPGAVIACATLLTVRHVERGGGYSALLFRRGGDFPAVPCLVERALADVVTYPLSIGLLVAGIAQAVPRCTPHPPAGGCCRCQRLPRRFRLFPGDQFPRLCLGPHARTGVDGHPPAGHYLSCLDRQHARQVWRAEHRPRWTPPHQIPCAVPHLARLHRPLARGTDAGGLLHRRASHRHSDAVVQPVARDPPVSPATERAPPMVP